MAIVWINSKWLKGASKFQSYRLNNAIVGSFESSFKTSEILKAKGRVLQFLLHGIRNMGIFLGRFTPGNSKELTGHSHDRKIISLICCAGVNVLRTVLMV